MSRFQFSKVVQCSSSHLPKEVGEGHNVRRPKKETIQREEGGQNHKSLPIATCANISLSRWFEEVERPRCSGGGCLSKVGVSHYWAKRRLYWPKEAAKADNDTRLGFPLPGSKQGDDDGDIIDQYKDLNNNSKIVFWSDKGFISLMCGFLFCLVTLLQI